MADTPARANDMRQRLAKATQDGEKWEGDEMPSTDSVRQIEHIRHGHRNTIGPPGIALLAIFGKGPWDEDVEADAIAELIIAAHNHLPALLDYIDEIEKILIKLSKKDLAPMDRIAELEKLDRRIRPPLATTH